MKRVVPNEFFNILSSNPRLGLTSAQVNTAKKRYGTNNIIEAIAKGRFDFLRDALRDPMIWFLIIISTAYLVIGETTEALVLILAIIPIAGMDAYLHRRTNVTASSLAGRLATRSAVFREGKEIVIDSVDVVPGDLVKIYPDEYFPADGVLVDGDGVQVDESSLTGESYPISKKPYKNTPKYNVEELELNENHWAFAGSRVLSGTAWVRIIYTGKSSLYGEIVSLLKSGSLEKTPLQIAIHTLVITLLAVSAAICVILGSVRLLQGFGWIDALISSATLAVAALPEEFPIVYTFFLGVGVYRMAKRKVLVKRGVAVENIGRTTCICTDKTGTITEGIIHLKEIVPAENNTNEQLIKYALQASSLETVDPINLAIDEFARKEIVDNSHHVVARFPFTEDRKRETAAVKFDRGVQVTMKGAPETVFKCVQIKEDESLQWKNKVEKFAASGQKVLACAYMNISEEDWNGDEPTKGYKLAGLLVFEDPPRKGVKEAIAWCKNQNIRVLMITGDHQKTAEGIAEEIGLVDSSANHSINAETCEDLENQIKPAYVNIISRATPNQKLKIVRALKNSGEIVAVTGDGVNDAPALQIADISIAMGERGTQSAREVSSIILMDDNFSSIVHAISEGRQLFRNLQLSFQYLLTIHFPLVLTAMLIPLVGYPLLYHPIHIVWLEMIIHPTALLAFQEPANNKFIPKNNVEGGRFFSRTQWIGIIACGVIVGLAIYITYHRSLGPNHDQILHARAMALLVLVFTSVALTAGLSRLRTWASRFVTVGTFISAFIFLKVPLLAPIFMVESPHLDDFLVAGTTGLAIGGLASVMGRPNLK